MGERIPSGTIEAQLRRLLKEDGMTPEEATQRVLGPYHQALLDAGNDSLVGYSRPQVLRDARRLWRVQSRRREDAAFRPGASLPERLKVADVVFTLPSGERVTWADATREQHELRVSWLLTYIGTLETDLGRHERAAKLLSERGADRLRDVDGWEELIGDPDEDSGDGEAGGADASGEAVS